MHHLRGGDPHHSRLSPTWGASLASFSNTPVSPNSEHACGFDAAILAPHVTGRRAWPEHLGRDFAAGSSCSVRPHPVMSRALQMGGDWAWRPETATAHWLRGRRRHPRDRLRPALLVLCLQFVSLAASWPTWREPGAVRAQACCCAPSSQGGWASRALAARSFGLVGVLRLWLLGFSSEPPTLLPRGGQSSTD